ncbi:MAG: diadenylate cyclase CdaA [Acutalibacteraceae bacterium]|nr:diadenylate cyclase CdaA [Acutalibacteraceae bacterium]
MAEKIENINLLWDRLLSVFSMFTITDLVDIALVAFLIFSAIKMLKETRGIQIVKGLLVVGAIYFVINLLDMHASSFLFKTILSDFIIVLIILFSPEIRHALETMGRRNFAFFNFFGAQQGDSLYERKKSAVLEVCKACSDMSDKKIGALIVFERETMVGDVIKTGTVIDAKVNRDHIESIFFPNSPLHDGGLVIRDGRAYAAGCILPLTDKDMLTSHLGTRHRAALGITEKSDAIAIVVSEETGKISVAHAGTLHRGVSDGVLMEKLITYILPQKENMAKGILSSQIAKVVRFIKEKKKK